MSPFITFRDENKEGILTLYVLQREFPHYVATLADHPIEGTITQIPVAGYHLYITFQGTIRGNYIASYTNAITEIEFILTAMSRWFLVNRINTDPKRYKKWLVQS